MIPRLLSRAGIGALLIVGCTRITDNERTPLSLQFDELPSPSVVLGDSLRDTTGAIAGAVVRAFNYRGDEIASPAIRFYSADRGVSVDSITGVIRGDSLRTSPARIIASVGSLQAQRTVEVTLRPDAVAAVNERDTLQYSLIDTTLNVSAELTVRLTHGVAPSDSAVRSYIVSFAVVSGGSPQLAELVTAAGRASLIDTTDANGVAGRALRIRPAHLAANIDSVIVNATVRHRGTLVNGSPVRLVLELRPRG